MATTKTTKPAEADYSIKPTAVTPSVDTSTWPLLLKNYEKLLVRSPFLLDSSAKEYK
jgi:H/ACA ribonucleoprotein complex subunit 4